METPPESAGRDAAKVASRCCPRCSGEGMCEAFDPLYDGRRMVRPGDILAGREVKRNWPLVVAAHCTCAMGRWMRALTEPEIRARIPDLEDVFAGRSRYVADDPTGTAAGPFFLQSTEEGGIKHVPPEPTAERIET